MGPTCHQADAIGAKWPVNGIRPWVAFRAATPVNAAGPRNEIARSLPIPMGDMPEATAADSPPEDPPGVRSKFHGLLVRPVTALSVSVHAENSGALVLASRIPPAALMRLTAVASSSGMNPAKILEPRWVGMPAVSRASLTVTGTP